MEGRKLSYKLKKKINTIYLYMIIRYIPGTAGSNTLSKATYISIIGWILHLERDYVLVSEAIYSQDWMNLLYVCISACNHFLKPKDHQRFDSVVLVPFTCILGV